VKRRKRRRTESSVEASYVCDVCGEEIVIPVDLSAGKSQQYVEDCPVCCRPQLIRVEFDEDGEMRVWAEREYD
jgi:transcription elongation factor Elf1